MRDIRSNPNMSVINHVAPATLPEYVKEATIDILGVDVAIPPTAFAFIHKGESSLPCHTKAACFISRLYFEAQRDMLDSTQQRRVDAKLAEFEALHLISKDETKLATMSMDVATKTAAGPALRASQVAMAYSRNPNDFKAGELIAAARELKTAGAMNQFIEDWAFDRPLRNADRQVRKIANMLESEQIAKLANKLAQMSPRKILNEMPYLASLMQSKLPVPMVQVKLAALNYYDEMPIKLLNHEVDASKLLAHLPKIAMLTELPLMLSPLRIPRDGWEATIEDAGPTIHRQILDNIPLV